MKLPEHVHAPACHSCEEARAEVSSRVDGVSTVEPHGHADGQDDEADAQRLHAFRSADVLPVGDGQDAQDQSTGRNYLGNDKTKSTSSISLIHMVQDYPDIYREVVVSPLKMAD